MPKGEEKFTPDQTLDLQARRVAHILGLAGLIPFVFGAVMAWAFAEYRAFAFEGLIVYAALIVTFIGALHWGRLLSSTQGLENNSLWLVWSITPSLIAWVMVFLPVDLGLLIAIGVLFLCLVVDVLAHSRGRLPNWMMRLRYILTSGASASLFLAWISGLDKAPVLTHLLREAAS